jgi:hypothetical protein
MLAGANHFDFPGLSVITAPNVEENPDRKTRVCLSSPSLKLEPDGAPGLVDLDNATETAAMDPAIALSGVIIRMVRISPGTTDGAWHLWKGS